MVDAAARLRGARIMHLALTVGLALAGGVFLVVRRRLAQPPLLATMRRPATVAALVLLGVLLAVIALLPRLRPARPPEDTGATAAAQWARWLGDRIVEWAMIEFFGLVGVIGWWLTGTPAMLGLAGVALVTLLARGPDRHRPPS